VGTATASNRLQKEIEIWSAACQYPCGCQAWHGCEPVFMGLLAMPVFMKDTKNCRRPNNA
jgi:hypothetical protein